MIHRYNIACFVLVVGLLVQGFLPGTTRAQDNEQKKLAQTGMKFLSLSVDPRAAAMGDAVTSLDSDAMMLLYNPAGMARLESAFSVRFVQTQWIADINYNQAVIASRVGNIGVFGLSVIAVDYGSIQETIRADNEQGFIDLGSISPSAVSVGLGYARALTDRFSAGAHVKYASQDLGDSASEVGTDGSVVRSSNKLGTLAYDFGILYKTGFESLNFAFSARNFAREVTYEVESFQLPLTLKIGLSMDILDLFPVGSSNNKLIFAVDAENPRDFSEQIKMGMEYVFVQRFYGRVGYVFPTDEQGINLGLGIRQDLGRVGFSADYAYTHFGVFSSVHRVGFQISI